MELTPREKDKLLIFTAALLAERRRARPTTNARITRSFPSVTARCVVVSPSLPARPEYT